MLTLMKDKDTLRVSSGGPDNLKELAKESEVVGASCSPLPPTSPPGCTKMGF